MTVGLDMSLVTLVSSCFGSSPGAAGGLINLEMSTGERPVMNEASDTLTAGLSTF